MEDWGKVNGILVSGTDEQLSRFHLAVCMTLNGIDRRRQTVRYTVFDKHLDPALKCAEANGVTVQRIERDNDGIETYPVLVQGQHEGWKA
jgi:hypothetical protein